MENPFEILENRINGLERKLDLILERLDEPKNQLTENMLLSIEELSDYLKITKPTIYGKVSRRELPHIKRGKRLYFKKGDIDTWLDKGKQKTTEEIRWDNRDKYTK